MPVPPLSSLALPVAGAYLAVRLWRMTTTETRDEVEQRFFHTFESFQYAGIYELPDLGKTGALIAQSTDFGVRRSRSVAYWLANLLVGLDFRGAAVVTVGFVDDGPPKPDGRTLDRYVETADHEFDVDDLTVVEAESTPDPHQFDARVEVVVDSLDGEEIRAAIETLTERVCDGYEAWRRTEASREPVG